MKTNLLFNKLAKGQTIPLLSALRANTPPYKKHTPSHKFLTLSIFLLLSFFTTNAWGADTWTLVKNVNDLAVGDEVVIAASGSNYALGTTQNNNNRAAVSITKSGDNITWTTAVQVLTLEAGTKSGTFAFYTGRGYLYAASSKENYLRTQSTNNDNSSWKITITSAGVASITAQGTNTKNQLKKNSSSALFSCYSSGQSTVAIYKKQAACSYNINYTTNNKADGAGGTWSENNCFEQVGSTTEWRYEMTLPGGGGSFWVGNGAWVNNKSEVQGLSFITFVGLQGTSCGTKPYPGEGAVGYVRIYSDSESKNYYAAFQPTYQIASGIEGQTWTHQPFTLVLGNKYETDLVEIPSNFSSSYKYYVGPKNSSNGTIWVSGKSSTDVMNTMIGLRGNSNAAGSKGKFRIYDNSCDNNWYCSFIPYYNYKLLNDDGSAFYSSDYVSSEASNKSTTIHTSLPTKTGYTCIGWSRTQNATTADVEGGDSYNYWKANDTFYPVWEADTYTITSTLTNCSSSPTIPTSYTYTGLAANLTYTISPSAGYRLPDNITVSGTTYTWDKSTGTLTLTGTITSNVIITITAVQVHSITWNVNGTALSGDALTGVTTSVIQGGSITTLPSAPTAPSGCSEKVFVGWTDAEIDGTSANAPTNLYKELGDFPAINTNTIYYAVFADEEGGNFSLGQSGDFKIYANVNSTYYYAKEDADVDKIPGTTDSNEATIYTFTKETIDGKEYYSIYNGSKYIGYSGSSTSLKETAEAEKQYWSIEEGTHGSWRVTSKDASTRALAYRASTYNTFRAYSTSGINGTEYYDIEIGGGTSYSDYTTTCVKLPDPVLSFSATPNNPIEFGSVSCGGNTPLDDKESVSVAGENLQGDVTATVTGPYKIARTASAALADYTTTLTLPKTNAGAINGYYDVVYIISTPPAQSTESTTGTLTFTTTNGNTLVVNLSTPTVTCTQYTLTLVDRGVSTEQPTKYYAGETIDEAPADPTGVCTDPIHYVFDGWAEATVAAGSTTYTKVTFPYTVIGNTKFYAVYRYTEGNTDSDKFMSVDKEIGELVSGVDYVLTGYNTDDKEYALSCTQYESGKYKTKQIDVSESTTMYDEENPYYELTTTDNEIIWTITGDDENGYSFQNKSTGKYLNIEDGSLALNNSDPTKYTIEHYVGYDSELGKYVQYLNVIIQPLEDYSYYLSSYYKNSTAGVLFNLHSSSTLQLYLYKRAAATLYTTSPACGPMLEITSGKDIYVTSGYGTGRNTVIAQQTVEYRATRLKTQNGSAGGTAPDVKVAANGITIGGEVTDKVKVVELTQNKELIVDKYTITGTVTVQYTPTANNLQEEIQVQLAVDYNSDAKDNFTVHARSLPAEFVIVAKQGDKWYALNADMSSSKAQPANGQITLDDTTNPTKATYAPCNTIYTFDGVQNTGDRTYVRFVGLDGKYLRAAAEGNTGIQNYSTAPAGDAIAYNWKLYTTDNETYRFANGTNSRNLGLNASLNFGMYAPVTGLVNDIRILPYDAKCIYNYAPSNITIAELKSTSVTLAWDPVQGATKYQYRTDATNWTDAGTDPTVTINGLEPTKMYKIYIRAYHTDEDVTQECIDYAEISFATANCDDVPTNITYSADLTTITVTWIAQSATSTVKLYSDEEATTTVQTKENAAGSVTFTGLTKNTQYYVQVFAGGTCASPIVQVATKGVEVDIVEWYPQGIVVDINTDETVGVTLENEVSYGSGLGSLAEDLFFSKYFEGSGSLKMIAIYNGTGKDVDLTDYFIYKGHNGSANFDADDQDKISYPLSELGVIKKGQEIVLYSWPLNTDAEASVYSCSQTFLHSIANKSGQEANPRWILCGKDPTNSITPIYSDAMNFNGDDPLLLYKDAEIIDVFGATEGESPENNVICDGYNENGNYKTRSDESWVANDVSNMDYGKTAEDFPNGEIPDDVNVDDPNITAYTARVIMFRKNTVTSGTNAVTKNTDDFHTFAEEWEVRQVCRISGDGDLTCAAYQELGTFDYSDYYTKYVSMGEEQVFEKNKRNPDGTVTISIPELSKQSCRNIRIIIKDNNKKVISNQEYKVPIMITSTQGTDGQTFLNLQQNLATVEVDGSGNPTGNKSNLTLEQVREICKTCDVVVRDNATLTKVTDGTTNDHPQVRNVYVYEGASIVIPDGDNHNYTINGLSLRRKGDEVASAQVQGTGKFVLPADEPVCLDLRVDANNWHWFTLPYDCDIADVTWIDGTPAKYNTDWFLMYYDGESRAASTNPYDNHWKVYNGTTIEAGKGYIVGITGDLTHPNYTFELRFPMAQGVLTAEQTKKTVPVNAWGVQSDNTPNNLGWNLVGNPYLNYYKTADEYSLAGLPLIKYTSSDLVVGEFYEEENGNIPFLVTPIDGGWYEYRQELASEVNMMPFTAYFVQVGDPETHTNGQALNASFEASNRGKKSIVRRAPREVEEIEEPIIVRVELTNSKGESDKTSLVIADRFSAEYEMNADFFKWFGDYYNYYTKPVLYTIGADQGKRAFNALNEELAKQPIPMGMYAAQAGNYTFSLNQQFDLSRVEEVWLYDATQSTYTNLMQSDYTFSTSKVNGAGRFSLSVKLAPKVSTGLDNVTQGSIWATTHSQQVIVNGLEEGMQLWLYDATGKLLCSETTTNYQHMYSVPQAGAYFVSVKKSDAKQTIKVVVE